MSKIRIERIKLHNFKGVADLDFSFSDINAIILGGKNGYGKTTIFDAIELVLTGRIDRYKIYKDELSDLRRNLSQEDMPLVCSNQEENVSVDLYLSFELDDGHIFQRILTRKARTEEMKNPVDFEVFNDLKIREKEEDEPVNATKEDLKELGLTSFMQYYTTLNYMSQEESTRFLKSKEAKRKDDVQFIFNTEAFDRRINKIDKLLLKVLKGKIDSVNNEIQQKEQIINALRQYGMSDIDDQNEYLRIFNEIEVKWDDEDLRLSNEEYASLLSEGGVLDRIQYLLCHLADFNKWWNSLVLSSWLDKSNEYAFYIQYKKREMVINQWKEFKRTLEDPFSKIEISRINEYQFVVGENLRSLIKEEKIVEINNLLQQVRNSFMLSNSSQRAYNEMVEQRNRLALLIKEQGEKIGLRRCPLCGHNYDTLKSLLETVERTLLIQLTSFDAQNELVMAEYNRLKQLITEQISQLNDYFTAQCVNAEIVLRYEGLDKSKMEKNITNLTERGLLRELPLTTIGDTEQRFREDIQSLIEAYDETLNYDDMNQTYDSYVRYIPQKLRTEEIIKKKKAYLLHNWNRRKSQQMNQLTQEISKLNELSLKYQNMKSQLEEIKRYLIDEKTNYLIKVISDVEILFYIYTGRIMQDNFYGRGLFLKNVQGKYISFVTSYDSDVDALYKMSSGQLVALMMALLLSLNKLYSESKILAIDDPVQTIDDINIWGFVETLRHEFKDYQFLFSTHELSYGSFLRYKLSNMGIDAKYFDMSDIRK